MAEVEDERYIRLIQLLYYGGLFITKHTITTKLAETGESFDTVLKKCKIQLDREFGKNKHQHGKIFPATGGANIEEWDIQLLTKVLLIVFHDKLSKDQRSHLSQLIRVRNDIMHGSALDKESYDRIKDDTIDSLRTLSSFYDTNIQQACNEHINKSLQGLPDAQKVNQTLAYFHDKLEMTLKKVEDVEQNVDETKKAIPAMEEKIVDGICHKIQELENTLIEKLETLGVEKELRVTMQTELFVDTQNQELTNLIEKKLHELIQSVDSVCQEVQMPDGYQDVRKAAKELLDLFKQLKDVIYKGCKRRCIELYFECTSCEGLQNLLRLFHSDLYQNMLTKLALAIKQNFQLTCPIFITSEIPQATLLKTAQDLDIDCSSARNSKQPPGIINLPLSPKQNTELEPVGRKENVLPLSRSCDLASGIQLDMECLSVKGILNFFELVKGGEISTKLQRLEDALAKHYGQPIKMKASVNIQELINLLTTEGRKAEKHDVEYLEDTDVTASTEIQKSTSRESVEDAENKVLPVDEVEQDDCSGDTLPMSWHKQQVSTEARKDEKHVSELTCMMDTDKTASGKRQDSTDKGKQTKLAEPCQMFESGGSWSKKADSWLLVAAIDFGTIYSGWAFSFKNEFDRDPLKIHAKRWDGGSLTSPKGPTCALIKPDGKTLQSFGFRAEQQYEELIVEEKHEEYYFFRRFKMLLFDNQGLDRNVLIEDERGKKLPAKTVFSLSIKYLKDDLTKASKNYSADLKDEDILWVLTVPAIWNDAAKQFMREAAQDAGILGSKLTIALEPEAASLYCRFLPAEKCVKGKIDLASFDPGKRYLVLDAGGGVVDITVHEVMNGGHVKKLHKASGGAWGGTKVDDAFMAFLSDITGPLVMSRFKSEHLEDYFDLIRDFEVKKRSIRLDKHSVVTFRIPLALADLVKEMMKQTLKEAIKQSSYANKIELKRDKLCMDPNVARSFFELPIKSIVSQVRGLLEESVNRGVEAILMVGGFSESRLLQEAIRNAFPRLIVIVPDEAGLMVLKGAVIFGHSLAAVCERASRFTHGADARVPFDPDTYPLRRMIIDEKGEQRC